MSVASSLPLTSVTAADIQQDLISIISNFYPDWSDKSSSNSMFALLESTGALGELMYAYINKMARECFIQWALDPRSITAHAKGCGYTPQCATPSAVSANLSIPVAVTNDTVVPAGSTFATSLPGITYELVADATFLQNTTAAGPVNLLQQKSQTQEFTVTGAPGQTITLNQVGVMPPTISVLIDGTPWDYVESFVDSTSSSLVYSTIVSLVDYSVSIVFGDGVTGSIPRLSGAGQINFKTGGGSLGAIAPHSLLQCLTEVRDAGNNAVLFISADNPTSADPGGNPESMDQIRQHAIAYLRAPRVLLDLPDIQEAVSAIPGVLSSSVVNWEVDPSLPHYLLKIYILPETSTTGTITPSDTLKEAVINYLTTTRPVVMGTVPQIGDVAYHEPNFSFQLFIKPGFTAATVKAAIVSLLNSLFDPTQTNIWGFVPTFGMTLYTSPLIAILQSVPGVRNIVMSYNEDINLNANEFPHVASIDFNYIPLA